MFSAFRNIPRIGEVLEVDVHSHLIPGIDDGSKSIEQTLELLKEFVALGYKKVITTPHIYHNTYPNTESILQEAFGQLKEDLLRESIPIEIELAAEYLIDAPFFEKVESIENLLTFGENYILVETPFAIKPLFFEEVIFLLKARGLKPVLAHPERYLYVAENLSIVRKLAEENGVLLQVSVPSLLGYYGPEVKKVSSQLVKSGLVHLLGSDMHNMRQMNFLQKKISKGLVSKILNKPLLNKSLR